jgi:carbonic anhydrase/acetyltransferase-like protein (isoleucine patch superfamily)
VTIWTIDDARPSIDPTAWIAPGVVLSGRVTVEAEANVWFGAVVRGDEDRILIATRANVQDGAILHTDLGCPLVVGAGAVLGHRAVVHGCTLEPDTLVGMGAVVLNGAVIGEGAVIGAGAVVTEGQQIPAGALAVGVPARVVGDAPAGLAAQASAEYVAMAARYAAAQ